MKFKPLPRSFYEPAADVVSPTLLGHFLLRRVEHEGEQVWVGGEIVETEAYLVGDPACHAYVRETPRNSVMWGEEGFAYVFRIYTNYFCVNAVCRPAGFAEAVLIRAIEPRFGIEAMRALRPVKTDRDLTNGPSKLCIALDLKREQNGLDLCDADSPLIIAHNPERDEFYHAKEPLVRTTRIGLTRGVDWPLRWYLGESKFVSKRGTHFDGPWQMPKPQYSQKKFEGKKPDS